MIPAGSRLTIGGKINLGNYQSLCVQLEADVAAVEDAAGVIAAFDQVLAGLGRDDDDTRARVDAWRKNVLGAAGPEKEMHVPSPAAEPGNPPAKTDARNDAPAVAPPKAEPVAEPTPKPKAKPKLAGATAANPLVDVNCEVCGRQLTKAEEKTSRLFVSRALCKSCIQSL